MGYDVIIIGAGSIGVPTALATSENGLKTLVIDSLPSVAQGDNKHAIGGIRASHSNIAKIQLCRRSLDIFSSWEDKFGDDIEWIKGGYTFIAYNKNDEDLLKKTVKLQQSYGLNINYVNPEKIKELIPGINDKGLLGGTYSAEDGSASPLLSIHSMFRHSKNNGAKYKFKEQVIKIIFKNNKVKGLKTSKENYYAPIVINASGSSANNIGNLIGLDLPVIPQAHEAGITEPIKRFFSTMVVDISPRIDNKFGNSLNYYFYQNREGKILFCISPNPSIDGSFRQETSTFLPQISKRIIALVPSLQNIKVRRVWRGLYPMTPDGNPIIGEVNECLGFINAVGMCGQGFMLGPGVGELLTRIITQKTTNKDEEILAILSHNRNFSQIENLK